MQSNEKTDCASDVQSLCGVTLEESCENILSFV